MPNLENIAIALIFIPLSLAITYMDVRYRRIPNKLVLVILVAGISLNTFFSGWHGLFASLGGLALAFGAMFFLHLFGTMGAGDVKFFAAIGSVIGSSLVPKTFLIVAITGGVLAICKMIYARRVGATMFGVLQFFYGLLPGQKIPRFEVPADRSYTLPYAVPICVGSVVSFFLFRA
ncbi:MAG TPA: prepilin peptidase [Pyrinomonadaceae bacterium]|jgi:Flp pilus assembly protein, protease CpaA|nr:prepilin peptidase [Pyrinomonadaceae bacterium]